MAQPTVKWYYSDGSWNEVTGSKGFYFTGPDTTDSVLDAVPTAPATETKFPEEFWVGDGPYANGVQVTAYEQDISTATEGDVVCIEFTIAGTAGATRFTSWDSDSHAATTNLLLVGTTNQPYTLLRGHINEGNVLKATGGASPSAGWKAQTVSTTTYALKGDTYYQEEAGDIDVDKSIKLLLSCFVPDDLAVATYAPVLTCKYIYT